MTQPDETQAKPGPEFEPESEGEGKLSREDRRAEAEAYAALAEELSKGKPAELPDPPFAGRLRDAVLDARRFTKNAKQRQIRRLAQVLRETDSVEALRAALEGRTPEMIAARLEERENEAWRTRLLEEGDAALAEFIEAHPAADRGGLRALVRQASRSATDGRAKKAATKLLREIRSLRAAAVGEDSEA